MYVRDYRVRERLSLGCLIKDVKICYPPEPIMMAGTSVHVALTASSLREAKQLAAKMPKEVSRANWSKSIIGQLGKECTHPGALHVWIWDWLDFWITGEPISLHRLLEEINDTWNVTRNSEASLERLLQSNHCAKCWSIPRIVTPH